MFLLNNQGKIRRMGKEKREPSPEVHEMEMADLLTSRPPRFSRWVDGTVIL